MKIDLAELNRLQKDYPWPIPDRCPCCGGRLWKHDFVTAYFYPYPDPFYLRRLRCPDCRTTFRYRPQSHLPRFYYPFKLIQSCLFDRLSLSKSTLQTLIYSRKTWWRRFKRQLFAHLGFQAKRSVQTFFQLLGKRINPVSRSLNVKMPACFYLSTDGYLFHLKSPSALLGF